MHAFARQKGFQAIAGDSSIPPSIIQHLMSFVDPVTALQDYAIGQSYLKHSPDLQQRQLGFGGPFLVTHERRKLWFIGMVTGFMSSYFIAVAPYFLWLLRIISASTAIGWSVITVPTFLYSAFMFAKEARQIRAAMRLVKVQNDKADRDEIIESDDRD